MHRSHQHAMLLAQGGNLDDFARGLKGNRFRFDTENIAGALLIVAGAAAACWLFYYLLRLQQRRRGRASPLRLFFSLCQAHKLPWWQRWLLWRVARDQQLDDPARLFLEPERLADPYLGPAFGPRQDELDQIRDHLFGQRGETSDNAEPGSLAALHQHLGGPELSTAPRQ